MSDALALRDWATSGAMALTGRRDGPPRAAPGDPAGQLARDLTRVADLTEVRTGLRPHLPGIALLGERAAIAHLSRNGPASCGGAFRTVETRTGWLGLSLPRESDVSLVPALVESSSMTDPWKAVVAWAAERTLDDATARARLLGLACAPVRETSEAPTTRTPAVVTAGGTRRRHNQRPRVIDLTSLWAGPLCAHLLGLGDAEVIKVESVQRPDGARFGPPHFFDLLHEGHRSVSVDLQTPADIEAVGRLIESADLVLESSRARAVRHLGLDADEFVRNGTSWLSITAYGRASDWIGFGDDVAAGAGLVTYDGGKPMPCGDALADPLTGVAAAAAAAAALLEDRAQLIDVSMHHVAAVAALGELPAHQVVRHGEAWWVETDDGAIPVLPPSARQRRGRAPALGADNEMLLE